MPRSNAIDGSTVISALTTFARLHMVNGGSVRLRHYSTWSAATVSSTTIIKRLGHRTWEQALIAYREALTSGAADTSAVVELPVACRRLGADWRQLTVSDWPAARCDCKFCASPTIAEAYPDLVTQLCNPKDADKTTEHWVVWFCPRDRYAHSTFVSPANQVASGERRCLQCEKLDKWYSKHIPGSICRIADKTVVPVASEFLDAFRALLPGEKVETGLAIVVGRTDEARVGRAIQPDALLGDRRIAIEVDEGAGSGGAHHDSRSAVERDTARDRALTAIGWATIRVRHPNSKPLPKSPAFIVHSTAVNGHVEDAAQVAADQARRLIATRPDTTPATRTTSAKGKPPASRALKTARLSDEQRAAQRALLSLISRWGSIIAAEYWGCYRDVPGPDWARDPTDVSRCLTTLEIPHHSVQTRNPFRNGEHKTGVEVRVHRADFDKILRWTPSFQKLIDIANRIAEDERGDGPDCKAEEA